MEVNHKELAPTLTCKAAIMSLLHELVTDARAGASRLAGTPSEEAVTAD